MTRCRSTLQADLALHFSASQGQQPIGVAACHPCSLTITPCIPCATHAHETFCEGVYNAQMKSSSVEGRSGWHGCGCWYVHLWHRADGVELNTYHTLVTCKGALLPVKCALVWFRCEYGVNSFKVYICVDSLGVCSARPCTNKEGRRGGFPLHVVAKGSTSPGIPRRSLIPVLVRPKQA